MSTENEPGAVGIQVSPDTVAHLPIDRANPRAGHEARFAPFEDSVRDVSLAAAPSPVPDPDARMHDQIIGINTRSSTHPFWATVRAGFEDIPNLGKKGPDISPAASPDPLQEMELSPQYERSTFRVTPGQWDENLVMGA